MVKVSVIGATGYAGAELIRLLLSNSKGIITAATVTGPNKQPLPTSSTPHIFL